MIDQRFMQSLADDMKDPMLGEEAAPEMLLAAGPARTDEAQAFVGTRLNVPRAGQPQPTKEERQRLGIQLFDSLAGMPKGVIQQTVGLPGDLESIGRAVLDYFGYDVNQETALPTTEDIAKRLESALGPVVPKGQTTIVPTAEREKAARMGETIGEFLPLAGIPEAVVGGGRMIGRAVQATKNMPVGMSTQIVGEGVSELGFYSAAKQAVDSIQQPKGTGDQFLKQIEKTPGVKPEEIKWTGLDDFLKSKKSVTKAEVQEFLDKNRVEIKEIQLGDIKINEQSEYALPEVLNVIRENQGTDFDRIRLALVNDYDAYQALTRKFPNLEDTDNWGDRVLEDIIGSAGGAGPKFSKYTLPGGENYREILITLPAKMLSEEEARIVLNAKPDAKLSEADIAFASRKNADEFRSQHFEQPNILAHMRVNDRVDADGKKVLFIEEVQSDWHQAGRKTGYKDESLINKNIEEQRKSVEEKTKALEDAKPYTDKGMDAPQEIIERFTMADDRLNALRKEEIKLKGAIPDAPFKTTWHELAMKRAIQLAAEGGYDRVAFTTGKTQAERYDLSKQIDSIEYFPESQSFVALKGGKPVISEKATPERLADYIGKDAASKLLEQPKVKARRIGQTVMQELSGQDLQVGGEGMKGFYDQILPKFLDKYAKKWDAKTGMTKIQTESKGQAMADADLLEELGTPRDKIDTSGMVSVQYIDVTPKMKESVLTKGQPLFAIGAGGAAVQQEENE